MSKQGEIEIGGIPLDPIGAWPSSAELPSLEAAMSFAVFVKCGAPWWIGDLVNYAQHRYGDTGWQIAELVGVSLSSVNRYAAVARKVGKDVRRSDLSWTHHACVANFPPDVQVEMLQHAATKGLGSTEFMRWIKRGDENPLEQ